MKAKFNILFLILVLSSCYQDINSRLDTWKGRPAKYLILQSGFPDSIYVEIDPTNTKIHTTILLYNEKNVSEFSVDKKPKILQIQLDSIINLLNDTTQHTKDMNSDFQNNLSEWGYFKFGIDEKGMIKMVGFTGFQRN